MKMWAVKITPPMEIDPMFPLDAEAAKPHHFGGAGAAAT
jgi:hypothetical protein